jgi:xanthine dehydrogenase/oxidase
MFALRSLALQRRLTLRHVQAPRVAVDVNTATMSTRITRAALQRTYIPTIHCHSTHMSRTLPSRTNLHMSTSISTSTSTSSSSFPSAPFSTTSSASASVSAPVSSSTSLLPSTRFSTSAATSLTRAPSSLATDLCSVLPESVQSSISTTLHFRVNGIDVSEETNEFDPEMSLLTYLRESDTLQLSGAKHGCGEGGCGACTVMVSRWDPSDSNHVIHESVNACLVPVAAVHGAHVTTSEGIGTVKTGLHPVQDRIAKLHGSQCGFCTPGIVVALYSFLKNNPRATQKQIEHSFDGNLCRCTGYRPILAAAKSFASDFDTRKLAAATPHIDINDTTHTATVTTDDLDQANNWPAFDMDVDDTVCSTPPPPLKLNDTGSAPILVFAGQSVVWAQPTSLDTMTMLKAACVEHNIVHRIVAGNTELGIEMTMGPRHHYPVLLSTQSVPELHGIETTSSGVQFGASVSLNELQAYLQRTIESETKQPHRVRACQAILDQLRWFSSTHIRNVATPGGNVMTASPIADLNPVLQACEATLTLASKSGGTRTLSARDFFTGYRQTLATPDEVLVSIEIPFTEPNQYVRAFKQAKRRDDDISIVTACINMTVDPQSHTIQQACLSYGGMAPATAVATHASSFLVNQPFTSSTIHACYEHLRHDFVMDENTPGGQPEYRHTLAASFLYKFYVHTCGALGIEVSPKVLSAASTTERPVSYGRQTFQVPNEYVRSPQHDLHVVESQNAGHDVDLQKTIQESQHGASVGQPFAHLAALHQVTGEAVYVPDVPLPSGGVYAALVLSDRAVGEIESIDTSAAESMSGFVTFVGADDVPGQNTFGDIVQDEELFASKHVKCVGQVIGLVCASTEAAAERAAAAVRVRYKDAPGGIFTIADAIAHNSFHGDASVIEDGDVAAGFAEADHVLEGKLDIGGQEHFYLETQGCIVVPKENDEFHLIASTQNPSTTQASAAAALGVSLNKVVCEVKRLGGGFGGKEARCLMISNSTAVAAKKLNRPVKTIVKRETDMRMSGQRGAFAGTYKIGFTNDGRITTLESDLYTNGGVSTDLSPPIVERGMFHVDNAYKIPNVRVVGHSCKTNKPSNTAFRGFGGPQGILVCETAIDRVAAHLGMDVRVVRELNLYREGDRTHYRQELTNCNIRRMWNEVMESSQYEEQRTQVQEFNSANAFRKQGIALMPVKFGCAFTVQFMNQGGGLIHVYTDGSVLVTHGGTEMGQGLHTKMAQIVSTELGVPLHRVNVGSTSTEKVPNTSPTAASMSSDINGAALQSACDKINARLQPLREQHPDASWNELVLKAYFDRISLSDTGFHKVPNVGYDFETGEGTAFRYYCYGVACTRVEIDVLTGDYQVLRADLLMDVGSSLNPAIDIGQVEGAFVQGMGWFTMEELVWGDSDHKWVGTPGSLVTVGPGAYKIPSFNDVPLDFRVSLLKDGPNPAAVHSSKAVGEPPLCLATSVVFALKDAISAARADRGYTGYFHANIPLTSERIRMACADEIASECIEANGGDSVTYQPKGSW